MHSSLGKIPDYLSSQEPAGMFMKNSCIILGLAKVTLKGPLNAEILQLCFNFKWYWMDTQKDHGRQTGFFPLNSEVINPNKVNVRPVPHFPELCLLPSIWLPESCLDWAKGVERKGPCEFCRVERSQGLWGCPLCSTRPQQGVSPRSELEVTIENEKTGYQNRKWKIRQFSNWRSGSLPNSYWAEWSGGFTSIYS